MFYSMAMPWPSTIPHDLAQRFAELDQYRSPPNDADRWNTIKEWLERHEVEPPDNLPMAPELPHVG